MDVLEADDGGCEGVNWGDGRSLVVYNALGYG
jgi:hypothetical protein